MQVPVADKVLKQIEQLDNKMFKVIGKTERSDVKGASRKDSMSEERMIEFHLKELEKKIKELDTAAK